MTFYIAKTVSLSFDRALEKIVGELKKEGFSITAEVDVAKTLKEDFEVSFRRYRTLSAFHPLLAHRALETEDKAGLLLPCNVIVQEVSASATEVMAADPRAMFTATGSPTLEELAKQLGNKLESIIGHV
ncbi:DUF302 domain-containing protein [Candidatus Fermentibacteria bacterium]|nr:DUF302 domain-containing protein [Candidatus Fermentibacteria bacterium]